VPEDAFSTTALKVQALLSEGLRLSWGFERLVCQNVPVEGAPSATVWVVAGLHEGTWTLGKGLELHWAVLQAIAVRSESLGQSVFAAGSLGHMEWETGGMSLLPYLSSGVPRPPREGLTPTFQSGLAQSSGWQGAYHRFCHNPTARSYSELEDQLIEAMGHQTLAGLSGILVGEEPVTRELHSLFQGECFVAKCHYVRKVVASQTTIWDAAKAFMRLSGSVSIGLSQVSLDC